MYHISTTNRADIGYMEMIISKLMKRGIRIADCLDLKDEIEAEKVALANLIKEKYNILNPNSSQQIITYLKYLSGQVDLKVKNDISDICYDSYSKKWTSKADALEKLADLGYEFAVDLLDYRHAKKYAEILTTFIDLADDENLVHPYVTLGKTHRINYSNPALMNIPKELLWRIVKPYTSGNSLYSVDIKNQEPSILINWTNSEELKPALTSDDGLYETMFAKCFAPETKVNVLVDTLPENRVYKASELAKIGTISPAYYKSVKPQSDNVYYNGKRVTEIDIICAGGTKGVKPELPKTVGVEVETGEIFDVAVEWEENKTKYKKNADYELSGRLIGLELKVSKAERKEFKVAWLAISYGASIKGIEEACKIIDGNKVYKYITKINGLEQYRKSVANAAKSGVSSVNTLFGSKIFLDEDMEYMALKRTLMNLPIQGTGADILSFLVQRIEDYTHEHDLENKLSLYFTRHDELIIEVDGAFEQSVGEDKIKEILADMLEHQIDDWVPFKIEIGKLGR